MCVPCRARRFRSTMATTCATHTPRHRVPLGSVVSFPPWSRATCAAGFRNMLCTTTTSPKCCLCHEVRVLISQKLSCKPYHRLRLYLFILVAYETKNDLFKIPSMNLDLQRCSSGQAYFYPGTKQPLMCNPGSLCPKSHECIWSYLDKYYVCCPSLMRRQ